MVPTAITKTDFRLYLITDDQGRSPDDLAARVRQGIEGGATAVQFREKNCGPTNCAKGFAAISQICENANIPFFLNADLLGRFEISTSLTGIHYSDRTLPARRNSKARATGYSAHGIPDAICAFSHEVDFCTLSPIFATPSKEGILDPIGTEIIRQARKNMPDQILVALGGINEQNAEQCIASGADGIAVIRAIMGADDPARAAARLRQIVENFIDT